MNSFRPSTVSPPPAWQPARTEASPTAASERRTLDQRLAEGKMSLAEALRTSMGLADAMRSLHDQGRVHGALTPACVEISSTRVELLPPRMPQGLVTPYTAPEVLRGRAADAQSDIFSFGAIVYEMVTGRWPFEAETPEALAAALLNSPAPGSGNPVVDRWLAHCLAKDPSARWQRIQKAQMELKLLTVSARRSEGHPRRDSVEALVRAEVQMRIAGRLDAQEKAVAELQQAVSASLQAVQAQLCTIEGKLAEALERATRAEGSATEAGEQASGVAKSVEAAQAGIARGELLLKGSLERVSRSEQTVETVRRHAAEFADNAAVQLHALEQTVRSQADALESARRAMAQTDDLVERVVEALDSLQSIVLERSEDRSTAVN